MRLSGFGICSDVQFRGIDAKGTGGLFRPYIIRRAMYVATPGNFLITDSQITQNVCAAVGSMDEPHQRIDLGDPGVLEPHAHMPAT